MWCISVSDPQLRVEHSNLLIEIGDEAIVRIKGLFEKVFDPSRPDSFDDNDDLTDTYGR